MSHFYVPYSGDQPAPLTIKGHKLIVLARDKYSLEDNLDLVGADHLEVFRVDDSEGAQQMFFTKLAKKNEAGVLILPDEASYDDLMRSLEDQLPWLQ